MSDENRAILQEINDKKSWFQAIKVGKVWAKELTESQTIKTLEGEIKGNKGDFLCRGWKGDLWAQAPKKFHAKYIPTDEVDDDGFRHFRPDPKASRVMAAKIDRAFSVMSSHGLLQGQAGDYLLKSIDDEKVEFPSSVWIVDEVIFATTYKRV